MTPQKRVFDLVLVMLLSVVLTPVLLGLMAVMVFTMGRPVFYKSERMRGVDQPFTLWKLRTMRQTTNRETGVSGGDKSDRIPPFGRFLRKTRLDELPQLWNILRGDISFVGPRPPLREYVERFPDLYAQVLKSRPGVTGLASLRYHRTEERLLARCRSAQETDATYARRCVPRKAALDLIYQRNQNICYDVVLIVQTVTRLIPK
ncbi:sugar transferase [Oceaniglobus ichthyenteri]|uniref:sugar transferase n=1 Tax=Oceaniglobus ichthyenteri TaxID=2136177 RepID=UPI000D335F37|nr:sugar transferase [Oceaniglobus ichthyenteri]